MNEWKYEPARDRELHGLERHRSLLRENGLATSLLRLLWWGIVRVLLKVWHRLRVTGCENLPAAPPFIIVANHTSHLDAPILATMLPISWRDQVYPVAASDFFFEKRPTAAFADWFLNALAIRRRSARRHDLDDMRARLVGGPSVFIIFPEGTRSRSGEMQAFLPGIGRLAAQSGVAVVPCHLDGCHRAWPPGGAFIKPLPITVRIGEPLRFAGIEDNRAGWEEITRQLRAAVESLAAE